MQAVAVTCWELETCWPIWVSGGALLVTASRQKSLQCSRRAGGQRARAMQQRMSMMLQCVVGSDVIPLSSVVLKDSLRSHFKSLSQFLHSKTLVIVLSLSLTWPLAGPSHCWNLRMRRYRASCGFSDANEVDRLYSDMLRLPVCLSVYKGSGTITQKRIEAIIESSTYLPMMTSVWLRLWLRKVKVESRWARKWLECLGCVIWVLNTVCG